MERMRGWHVAWGFDLGGSEGEVMGCGPQEFVVKEEETVTGGGGGSSSSSSSSLSFTPQPMEGLNEVGTPPFLTKIYDMVEDHSTDSVVSWSTSCNSFVVWDSHKFSTTLPSLVSFKHMCLPALTLYLQSTPISPLHSPAQHYFPSFAGLSVQTLCVGRALLLGFRKVDPDRWEFANEGFLAGQRHLLKGIKRRRRVSQSMQERGVGGACVEVGEFGLEGELERLKRDRNILMAEIVRLRHQQLNSRDQLSAMETRLQATENKQQKMTIFLAKALKNPSFMQQLVHKTPQSREILDAEINGKRRLIAGQSLENLQQDDPVTLMDYSKQQDLATMEPEMNTFFSPAFDSELGHEIKESALDSDITASQTYFGDTILEDLLIEDLVTGDPKDEVIIGDCSQIDVPVEDLVADPDDWNHMDHSGSKP
ncbi:LOW QUALITY PROTEIN: heat stress transcription factor A-2-like [Vigna umbellata]|uniref:LOW QUALITY PROTEIN: heat stress transcription factor A-2-like n=1 Tax=Vigna umbellata TaxID=87088 RepID=UPI001F5EA457|nr:LOW QUALITY PROTEIN: heat stress transcription factor A-2-like [Vigna umbellata]